MAVTPLAIVHDYLTQRGGAERVVLTMHRGFPTAPIYTSLYDANRTFAAFAGADVRTSGLNRIGLLRRYHRLAFPALAPAFSAMSIDADVVLCQSTGWAHGVRTRGRKIVYCNAPARWLYQSDAYLEQRGRVTRALLKGLRPPLVRWDRRAALSADTYLANSRWTREGIRRAYGIDAEILHPPHSVDIYGSQRPVAGLSAGFFLCVSRLLGYKHVDAVLEAFATMPSERLVVVGSGPDEARLRGLAPTNARFCEAVSEAELRWLYANARAIVAASYEDFGLVPLEAAAFGTPSIVLRFGGYLDTVIDGRTGIFFEVPSAGSIAAAVHDASRAEFDHDAIRAHSRRFAEAPFLARLREIVEANA